MTLTITPEVEALLQRELESGRFRDSNEVIATALKTLAGSRPESLEAFDALIQEGIESADSGELYDEGAARAYLAKVRESF